MNKRPSEFLEWNRQFSCLLILLLFIINYYNYHYVYKEANSQIMLFIWYLFIITQSNQSETLEQRQTVLRETGRKSFQVFLRGGCAETLAQLGEMTFLCIWSKVWGRSPHTINDVPGNRWAIKHIETSASIQKSINAAAEIRIDPPSHCKCPIPWTSH